MMNNLSQPEIQVEGHKGAFRLALLNTKRSAWVGLILLILPGFFLLGVLLKHYAGIDFPMLTGIYTWIGAIDAQYGDNSILNWLIRFLLLLGPPIAAGVNLLSILHIRYQASTREIIVALKIKWLNLLIVLICSTIFLVFFFYLLLENINT